MVKFVSKWSINAITLAIYVLSAAALFADQSSNSILPSDVPVSNGKLIDTAPDGQISPVGNFAMNAILDTSGRYAIVTDSGYHENLSVVDMLTGKVTGSLEFVNSAARNFTPNVTRSTGGNNRSNGLYYGLAQSGSTIYASQGAASQIAVLTLGSDGSLTLGNPIVAQPGDFIAGLATDSRGNLYAVNNQFDDTHSSSDPADTTTPGSLAIYSSTKTGLQIGRIALKGITIPLPTLPFTPTSFPFAVATLSNGSTTYVTSQRDSLVYAVNTFDPTKPTLLSTIPVGKDPVALLISPDQSTLYVANADSDTISVIATEGDDVTKTISLRPAGFEDVTGVTPLGFSLSPNGKILYVALGDMNAVAVIDTTTSTLKGYIPAGWYPTVVLNSGSKLLIVNAKGNTPRNPNNPASYPGSTAGSRYVLDILEGTTQLIDSPTPDQLADDTLTVVRRNKLAQAELKSYGVLSRIGLHSGKIKHVIYIIKENRTYDQLLGDLKEGNGDLTLTMFGEKVTPNQHALAKRFVLLDNFYDSGDVSGDGWNWSTQGYATEYVARNVPYEYSSRGQHYNFEGQDNGYITGGFPALDPDGNLNSILAPYGVPQIPDVAESDNGHIWDDALESNLTIRNYGFFLSSGVTGSIPDNYPTAKGLQPPGHDLAGNSDPDFRQFDLNYPDSNAPNMYYATTANSSVLRPKTKYGRANEPSRYAEWAREFDMMINTDPSGSKVPNLMMVRFMCDHTSGARSGGLSPSSDVADNDYAVGELVEHISKSPIWKNTAIFVIEDDAQNGEDHVDCHRSVCFVASPYIKQGSVDHSFYNTDSVLRTMEILLGMKPMCQYDAVASPFSDFTSGALNDAQFNSILPDASIISEHNPDADSLLPSDPRRRLVLASDAMDFSHADAAPAQELNAIVWKMVKGMKSVPPKPQHHMIAVEGTTLDVSSGKIDDDD